MREVGRGRRRPGCRAAARPVGRGERQLARHGQHRRTGGQRAGHPGRRVLDRHALARSARPAAGPPSGTAPGPAWPPSPRRRRPPRRSSPGPSVPSATSTRRRPVEVTSAVGMPAARDRAQQLQRARPPVSPLDEQLGRPGRSATRRRRPRPATAGARSSCRIRIELGHAAADHRRRAAVGQLAAVARPASSCSATSHTFSLSTSVPSMSKSTAAGRRGAGQGLRITRWACLDPASSEVRKVAGGRQL